MDKEKNYRHLGGKERSQKQEKEKGRAMRGVARYLAKESENVLKRTNKDRQRTHAGKEKQ